ncbi:presenilin-associated rhomboid-like protein, mitochondrial isoform X2 [Halichondria panicea]
MISLNSLVFLLWRVAPMYRLMDKYFISSISSKSSLPLLLSAFSHTEVWHLGLNMLVLWSFTPALMRTLEDMDSSISSWPYYLTGGTFASMVGYYSKVFKKLPIGSLGASGALMAVVSMVVFNNPDSVVYLIFLPFVPIPASWALGGVVALDAIGVIRGWQFFDHAGHLGGVLFAVLYQWWLHKVCSNIHLKSAVGWFKARSKTNS